jgi:hypothetical protein
MNILARWNKERSRKPGGAMGKSAGSTHYFLEAAGKKLRRNEAGGTGEKSWEGVEKVVVVRKESWTGNDEK